MALRFDPKSPGEEDDFTLDWRKHLAAGESISSATAATTQGTVSPDGTVQVEGTLTTVRITGGEDGEWGEVTITIVTSRGRTLEEGILFQVKNR